MCATYYKKGSLNRIMHTNTKPVFIVQACILLSSTDRSYLVRSVADKQQQFAGFVHMPCRAGKASQNQLESISEQLKFKTFLGGGGQCPQTPLVAASFGASSIHNHGFSLEPDHLQRGSAASDSVGVCLLSTIITLP